MIIAVNHECTAANMSIQQKERRDAFRIRILLGAIIKKKMNSAGKTVHIFVGGRNNINRAPIMHFLARLHGAPKVVTLDVDAVKMNRMTPKDIVDWLLESDVHFIIAHVHQGIVSRVVGETDLTTRWTAKSLKEQLWRLHSHPGFPSGDSLNCPIFLQVILALSSTFASYRR